jgi:hypothetical protein
MKVKPSRSPVTSFEEEQIKNDTIPGSPRNGSRSPNPLFAGKECTNVKLNKQRIGNMSNSEEGYYKTVFTYLFNELQKNPSALKETAKAFVKKLREDRDFLSIILKSPVQDSTRERIIQKLCAAATRL